jgi:hypothetical protein
VNGRGAVNNPFGSRYSYPNASAIYLTEDVETCLAERMFYFHREVLPALDRFHINGILPAFQQSFVLWEVEFSRNIPDVADLSLANASAFHVFPSLMLNPSQDYHHLKQGRANIQGLGYRGLRAPSARTISNGSMAVLFADQSKNVARITPFPASFRLICDGVPAIPFANHASQLLCFTAGEVMFPNTPVIAGVPRAGWFRVGFNH